ncbi:hypothetical protein L596_002762 [Steinernema carpocapsae]|uniref:Uncharacterized protein n=1 Tax=Steinernema carpocapsae TaxID=34508 RepID=A0A4U8UQI8_STECR|nr:hypothetical protein L596_002762 [Steinernema carpocapsae]
MFVKVNKNIGTCDELSERETMQQQHYRSQNADLDELGCPKAAVISKMQTGEVVTLMLGIFAILMTITIVVYYRYYLFRKCLTTVKPHLARNLSPLISTRPAEPSKCTRGTFQGEHTETLRRRLYIPPPLLLNFIPSVGPQSYFTMSKRKAIYVIINLYIHLEHFSLPIWLQGTVLAVRHELECKPVKENEEKRVCTKGDRF